RPLSNLVDVTNYVMFELGQPLHAFDYAAVRGQRIVVKTADDAVKTMKTLDDIERQLVPSDLLICDGEGPVALAGVMGGLESEVNDGTSRVLLEAASFEPIGIRRTGRRLGLHSESSHRFERGVDIAGADRASQRAAQLIAELGGGRVARGAVDVYPSPVEPTAVTMRVSRATQLTGVEFESGEAKATLDRLGLQASGDRDELAVLVPTYRGDLSREVDLIEELIRLHGYDNVPATLPATTHSPETGGDPRWAVREALTSAGLSEAITFGFTSPARVAAMRYPDGDRRASPISLKNPMTLEQSVMRTALLPNLLGAVSRNLKYGIRDVGLFEVGTVFLPSSSSLPDEPLHIAGVLCGARPGWLAASPAVDFFDLKGAVESLFEALDVDATLLATTEVDHLHPGVGAQIAVQGEVVGTIGEIHPATRADFEIEVPVFGFELELGHHLALPRRQMRTIANHPAVTRDISFFVSDQVPAARVREIIDAVGEALVERVEILEDFRDARYVPEGKKGLLWSITYRAADRTLTDKEVDKAHQPIVDKLLAELDAQQR
ncbi:MAG: phenylalanine--tRNA ligase subunit beta, partial [Acidimicrobiia bacterium]|nr:phenylalanine--tRNA ligase subunit beta [Acidimicrobiia bacterium]